MLTHQVQTPGSSYTLELEAPVLVQPPKRTGKVMLVEDEEFIIRALSRSLTAEGHGVVVFRTSLEALRALRRQPEGFELIIADTTMPRFSELELARELLRAEIKAPIVVLTGGSVLSDAEMEEFHILKALGKPFDMHELCSFLQLALQQREQAYWRS